MDHKQLVGIIQNMTGVLLTDDKVYLLDSRLRDIMKEYSLATYDDVAARLISGNDAELTARIIDQITTHETRFFRDESIFSALVEQMIPEWMDRRAITAASPGLQQLHIWSTACSTGQEPYSIAMMIRDRYPLLFPNLKIVATDISKESIERARAGRYSNFEIQRGVPPQILTRYFSPDGDGHCIRDEMKGCIDFKIHNLVSDPFPGQFDFIFCRNVLIYFDDATRKAILDKLRAALKDDGALVLGSSENLIGALPDYIVREFGLARYYEFSSQVTFFRKKAPGGPP